MTCVPAHCSFSLHVVSVIHARSMRRLKKLQRLDIGNNEIETLVSVLNVVLWL